MPGSALTEKCWGWSTSPRFSTPRCSEQEWRDTSRKNVLSLCFLVFNGYLLIIIEKIGKKNIIAVGIRIFVKKFKFSLTKE